MSALPETWQSDVVALLKDTRTKNPHVSVFGLNLPESWKGGLWGAYKGGQLHILFGMRAVTFGGKEITVFEKGKSSDSAPPSKTKTKK